jgi:lambda family phage minor tail protein L
MARDLSNTFVFEKNKSSNRPINLYIIEKYDGVNDLRFAQYDADVTYQGDVYSRFPLTHENISENTQGEIDQVVVTLSNISRLIQGYLETYDLRGKKVTIRKVWANQLSDPNAFTDMIYFIDSYTADENNVVVTLSSKFDVRDFELPARRYSRNYCSWKFKSPECGYLGAQGECNKTLQRCRELGNQVRFGGFPSIPTRRIFVS